MSVAASRVHAADSRCARRLRAAGAPWARARWLYDNAMPAGSAVEEDLGRDEEQRAEAELRRGRRPDADPVLRHDYEARLNHYLERRMARFGPLAELVDPDRFAGQLWVGSSYVRQVLAEKRHGGG